MKRKEPVWIEPGDALAIHDLMLAQHGGMAGLRDEGLLRSALSRPKHRFAYGNPDLPALAAAYAAGIIRDHPFLDGNKRTGFVVAATFLEINGLVFDATEEDVVTFTFGLAGNTVDDRAYETWLRAHSQAAKR